MTAPGVALVVNTLGSHGYLHLALPFEVAGVPFAFAAAMVGPPGTLDLVVVADTVTDRNADLLREITALGRALDVVDSRRTLTAILVGPRPDAETLNDLGSTCRVLPIGIATNSDDTEVANWLSMFVPLVIPLPSASPGDPLDEFCDHAQANDDAFVSQLASAARRSSEAVEQLIASAIQAAVGVALKAETE